MERSTWTDERLDDMVARNDSQFERILAEMTGFRVEMRAMRTELQAEMREMRTELHSELHDTRRDMFHGMLAIFGSLVAICAALIAHAL